MRTLVKRKLRGFILRLRKPTLYGLAAVLAASTVYHLYFANKIVPGVRLANVSVGGLSYKQALEKITQKETQTKKELNLWAQNGKTYQIKATEIELIYDWSAGVSRAFEVGRTGNFFVDTKDKLAGLIKPLKLNAKYSYNKDLLGGKVAEIRSEVNIPSVSAKLALNSEGKLETVPEVYGKSLDETKMYAIIRTSFDTMDFEPKILGGRR